MLGQPKLIAPNSPDNNPDELPPRTNLIIDNGAIVDLAGCSPTVGSITLNDG